MENKGCHWLRVCDNVDYWPEYEEAYLHIHTRNCNMVIDHELCYTANSIHWRAVNLFKGG